MLGVTLTEQEGSLWVRGLGMAKPVGYAWPRVRTPSFAPDPASRQAWGFLVDYDFGFMRTLIAGYYKTSVLVATTYNTFHDGSERTPYWTREFFHRRMLAEPPTTAVPRGVTRDRDRSQGTTHGRVDPAPMIGRWVNFDREAPDITGVTVRADGDRLAVSVDQADRGAVRHWPALPGVALAERTHGGSAIGFLALGDLFAEPGDGPHCGALCAYLNRGLLTIDTYVTDIRKAANVMTRVHLHLAEGATV
ncbi:MAG TPA: hypothetical protein VHT91_45300 [Kofleriaceae bacterium]|nr:hypothetical protein [Kofleriaceae bacterium]